MRAYEYVVIESNAEQVLERLTAQLNQRRVHVDALWMVVQGNDAVCRLVTDDKKGAVAAINAAGYAVSGVRGVFVHRFPDRPGILAEISQKVAGAGIALASAYPGAHGDLILACDDLMALENAVVEHPVGGAI